MVFEGDYQSRRLVLVEFPSLQAMEVFYESDSYQALESKRQACSNARIVGLDGCSEVFSHPERKAE